MLPRTQRQKDILDYIIRYSGQRGHEPSYAQIARHFGVKSKATIAKHIGALERRGLISRQHDHGSFGLDVKVVDTPSDAVCEVHLLGEIAAGTPIDAIENRQTLTIPPFLFGRLRPNPHSTFSVL